MVEIDLEIKQSYLNQEKIKEMKMFEKSKKNKNVSFKYIKKRKLVSGRKCVILND
jgi:hypothetical protein